jgi:hypothetical protein
VNRWNGGASEADQLPKTELNPLINPVLGRNLGRWAQVYFTTAPEKREQAVLELLHELEHETPEVAATSAAPTRSKSAERTFAANKPLAKEKEVACRSCGFRNPGVNQFCGQCGLALGVLDLGISASQSSRNTMPRFPMAEQPRIFEADDVQWLRDKSLTILEDSPSPGSRVAKSLLVMVLIGLGVFAYLRWSAQPQQVQLSVPADNRVSGASAPPPASSQVAGRSSAPAVSSEPKQGIQPASLAEKQQHRKLLKQQLQTNSDDPSTSVDAAGNADTGAQELKLAQRFLDGKTGSRDTSEAAKLLWKAVGKQNASAALLLSDLYVRGDGVSKNCDQARLLLIAAAKRGGAQAADQLRRLEASGCR